MEFGTEKKITQAKTDFFMNNKETECPIIECSLKKVGCLEDYNENKLIMKPDKNFDIEWSQGIQIPG